MVAVRRTGRDLLVDLLHRCGTRTITYGQSVHIALRLVCERGVGWPSGTIPSTAQRTARLLVPGVELADRSLGLVVEGGDDLVGVLFRVVKSQAADREIDDFMTVPRSRPG